MSNASAPANSAGISAQWFDGKSARRREVTLDFTARSVQVRAVDGVGDSDRGGIIKIAPIDMVKLSERIGNTPYRLSFPDGGLAVSHGFDAIESTFNITPSERWLSRLERASWAVALALAGLAAALFFAYHRVIPLVADAVASRIPRAAEKTLGKVVLTSADRWLLKTSRLEASDLSLVHKVFDELALQSGLNDEVELQFREMEPNALAIPGGTIVVTDGLVKLFKSDERLLAAVIAHELGHIHHRHTLRHLLQGSASALIVGALLGDVSGVSALITTAPIVLSSLHYTRQGEREADQYAFALLKKSGRSASDFADAMQRLEAMHTCLELRAKLLKKNFGSVAKGVDADDNHASGEGLGDTAQAPAPTIKKAHCATDPETALHGHEAEVADLEKAEQSTGYLHTHPVTRERIRAAQAAAK